MERYSVTESQLNTNGAISHINIDYGTDGQAALAHYHTALASGISSLLIANTATLVMMDDETGNGYTRCETVKGTGVYTPPEQEEE